MIGSLPWPPTTLAEAPQLRPFVRACPEIFYLRLPRETQAYVPRLLARSAIIAKPDAFEIELPVIRNNRPLRTLTLASVYDVAIVAEIPGTTSADIYRFNPGLKRSQ